MGDVAFRTGSGCAAFNYGWGQGDPIPSPPPTPPRTERKPAAAPPAAAATTNATLRLIRAFRATSGRRLANRRLATGRTLRVSARGLRRGRYTVRLRVIRAGRTTTRTILTSRVRH